MTFQRLALASLLAFAAFGAQAADKYDIDPTHTQVEFTYSHMGFSNITGRFDTVQGEFLFDPANPTQSSVNITIPVDSISTGVEKLDEHLLKADFFDAATYPTAAPRSRLAACATPRSSRLPTRSTFAASARTSASRSS